MFRKHIDGTPRVYDESLVDDPTLGLHRIHNVSVDDSDPRLSRFATRHHLPPRPHSTKPTSVSKYSVEVDCTLLTFSSPAVEERFAQ